MSKRAIRGLAVSGLLQGLKDLSADLGSLGAAVIHRYRRAGVRGRAGRPFRGEQLEDRLLLTLNVGLTANGDLLLSESSSGVDDLQVDYDNSKSEFIFKDANYSLTTTIVGATGGGTKEVRVPKNKVSGTQILVQTGAHSDVISVNAGFDPGSTFGLNLDGGAGTDLVKWTSAAQLASASITAESAEVYAVEVRTVGVQTWTTDISLFNNTKFMASNISVQSLFAGPKNLTVDATGLVTINGVVSATTSAFISMTGNQGVLLNAGSQVTVELGNLTLSAGTGAVGSALRILDGKVKSQGGTITLQGNSGSSASAGSSGVLLQGAEIVNQGAGEIFVSGTTAAGASSPGAGVSIQSGTSSSSLRSFNGLIEIWGSGGAAGSMGSELLGAEVLTQGSGAISVIGTSDSLAVGLKVASTSRIEAAGTGTVHVEGAGGDVPQPTITFSGLAASTPSPYTESGLKFTSASNFSNQFPQQMVGSTATSGFVDVTTVDGQLFSVQSMRVSETKGSIGPRSVTFTGTRLDGGTVQQTYTTDSKFEAETVVLIGFSGLTSFRFTFNETTWNDLQWSYAAPVDVSFGVAEMRAASGTVSLAASRLELTDILTLNIPGSLELWQSITGSGGIVKAGSGTVRVSSQAKYTGVTKVVSGLLKVDGSLAGSVTADGPGQVSGVGLVSGVLETSGTGSLLPGGIPGVLTAGGLQLGASGTLQADIGGTTAGSQHDQLVVNGTAGVSGSLQISLQGAYTGTANDQILLIANDGTDAVVGTFSGLPEGSVLTTGGVRWQVSYKGGTGNDVVLTCVGHQFIVTTTSSSGTGSLYQAIVNANDTAGVDEIVFTVAGEIVVSSGAVLPVLTQGVLINATTAPGYNGSPVVEINGTSAGSVPGFVLGTGAGGSEIRGFSIVNFAGPGILVSASDSVIRSNWIGLTRSGSSAANGVGGWGVGDAGVRIEGYRNVVGGLNASDRNVFGANSGCGLVLVGGGSNRVWGNYIGTSVDGNSARALGDGIRIYGGEGHQIGGDTPGAANLISGNAGDGVMIEGGNKAEILGNVFGVSASGVRLQNIGGISVSGTSDTVIGGASVGRGNVIGGSVNQGVRLVNTIRTRVQGNRIGTNSAGTVKNDNSNGVWIGASQTDLIVGGSAAGEGNLIAGNVNYGVRVDNVTGSVTIAGNTIGLNSSGTGAIGNGQAGIYVLGSPSVAIGGEAAGAGNIISGNPRGVLIGGAASVGTVLQGNWIGVNAAGTAAVANTLGGIRVDSGASGTVIGTSAAGNLISGNGAWGVYIAGATGTMLANNLIGLTPDGQVGLGNTGPGVWLTGDVAGTVIGGTAGVATNTISSNSTYGVYLESTTGAVRLSGNRIGTNAAGTAGRGNASYGVFAKRSQNLVIGTNDDGNGDDLEGNLISGNGNTGILIDGENSTTFSAVDSVVIAGNRIGTDLDGMSGIWNRDAGIILRGGVQGVRIGTDGNGVSDVAERNLISGNEYYGIYVSGAATSGNVIAGNYVGLKADGLVTLGNGSAGIAFASGTHHNRVGTDNSDDAYNASERNVVAGGTANIDIYEAHDNVIAGNYVGLTADGVTGLYSNFGILVRAGSKRNRIGTDGIGAANERERNVIGSTTDFGRIYVGDSGTEDTVIAGNYIGLNAAGTSSAAGSNKGVVVANGAKRTVIGTEGDGVNDSDQRNVIISNSTGLLVTGVGTSDTVIAGNYIGVLPDGLTGYGNTVTLEVSGGAQKTRIGTDGSNDAFNVNERNLLCSGGFGLLLSQTSDVVIAGNYIGVAANGTKVLPHNTYGIRVTNQVTGLRVGTNGDGVADAVEGNVISGNQSGLQLYNWDLMDLATADKLLSGAIPSTTATAAIPQADLTISSGGVAGNWSHNHLLPGRGGAYFAFRATGVLKVSTAGDYTLAMSADRGGRLLIDGVARIVDDGNHGGMLTSRATVNLTVGDHTLEWQGFEEHSGAGFELSVAEGAGVTSAITTANGWKVLGDAVPHAGVELKGGLSVTAYYPAALNSNAVVAGNLIGVLADGMTKAGNYSYGIYSNIDGVRFGGSLPVERNVISGNTGSGLVLDGFGLNNTGVVVAGNSVGVGIDGVTDVGNGGTGIYVGASNALIGGLNTSTTGGLAGAGNLVSGNGGIGVHVGASISGVQVEGNFIGTDISGSLVVKNDQEGVVLEGASALLGGSVPARRNLISGNGLSGVRVTGHMNDVQGNFIGTNSAGTAPLANIGSAGVLIQNGTSNRVGVKDDGEGDSGEWNLISGNSGYGVSITAGAGNLVAGNRIGTDSSGAAAIANKLSGVYVSGSSGNLIGTDADGISDGLERNLISGNLADGIQLTGAGTNQNVIAGNNIGLAAFGAGALANGGTGIRLLDYSSQTRIGGGKSAERNLVSGNTGSGIVISGSNSQGNWIAGNSIGSTASGSAAIANGDSGIVVSGAFGVFIGTNGDGTTDASEGNLISGNALDGIRFENGGSGVVSGNIVGTKSTGTEALGNGRWGVNIAGSAGILIGTNSDGVSDALERNLISGNGSDGVRISGSAATENMVFGNNIGTSLNGQSAIPNSGRGVLLEGQAKYNMIGGMTAAGRNVISGNTAAGVRITGGGTDGNRVQMNYIGVAADGLTALPNASHGVEILAAANSSMIGDSGVGNVISANAGSGILIDGSDSTFVRSNRIGTNAAGLAALPNGAYGVLVQTGSGHTRIGGGSLGARNLISGHTLSGVAFISAGMHNFVSGNYIGTDASGSQAIGNASNPNVRSAGILIRDAGTSFVVVGTDSNASEDATEGNLISGNFQAGVLIEGTSNTAGGQVVAGNLIGLKAGGGAVLGNQGPGVLILNSGWNRIGSNGDGVRDNVEGNVIAGNSNPSAASAAQFAPGVLVQDSTAGDGIQTRGNVIAGNAIGTDITGLKPLSNQGHGVVVLSAFETQVGLPAAGNLIRYNGGAGVRIEGAAENGNQASAVSTVSGNSFQANTGLPVDLGAAGITLNSMADAVTDFPIFTSAAIEDGKMTLMGFAPAEAAFELYLNAGRAGQQFGDGVTPLLSFEEGSVADLDSTTATYGPIERGVTVSDAAITQNRFKFTFNLPAGLTSGVQMTGLMTGPVSEFSPLILAGEQGSAVPPEITLDLATSTVSLNEGDKLSVDGAFYDPDSRAWTGTVNYGDGSGVQPLALTSSREFELNHTYTTPGTWTVTVEIVDNGLAVGTKTFTVTVANLVPVVDFGGFSLTKTVVEGGTATLAGSFTDGDGAHVVQVTWGDGGTSTVNLASGVYSFSATHVYADDSNSAGTVTATDVYAISVTVRDAVSASGLDSPAGLFQVEVSNQTPTVGSVQFGGTTVAAGGTVSVNEGTPLAVSGVFTDPGLLDLHTVRLDWGDGTKSIVTLPVGDRIFGTQSAFSHAYANNSSSGPYVLTMEFWDDDQPAEPTRLTWNINVADVSASGVTVSALPDTVNEMQSVQISGSFVDPGTGDAHQVRVIWGDGSPDSVLNLAPGVLTFGGSGLTHAYADNAVAGDSYTVQVLVSDLADAAAQGSGSASVLVQNVAPAMVGSLTVTRADGTVGAVNEGDVVIVTGAFADVSPVDRHRVLISWGDGRAATEATVNADNRTFTGRYTYRDNFAAASITAQVLDGRFEAGVFRADGGSVISAAVTQRVDNVAPTARIAPRLGSTPDATLVTVEVVEPGLDDVLTYLWEINTGLGYTAVGTLENLTFNSLLLGTPLIRVTVSDDDTGTDDYEVVAVFGTDSAETLTVNSTGFTRSGSGFGGIGLTPGENLWANQILVFGFGGADLLDASALPSGFTAILDGGQQQDYLLGGAGADFFYPNDGNDTVDGGEGSDSYVLKPNSVLTVIDTSGDNVLDFSLADFGNTTGITYDLTKIRSTGLPDADSDAQVVSVAGGVNHIVAAYGTFTTLLGSSYADSFIAASGSAVDGGGGKDTLYVGAGTTNATISGGADDDVLISSGTGIIGLNFSGDDGFDYLKNTGSITGLTFGGGADDDILENVGSILGTLNFGGDDGVDILTNTGTIGTLEFSGGADDDIFVNNGSSNVTLSFGGDDDILLSGAGTVGTLVFGGDSGADIFANLGTITSLTFNGGADDDVFVNVGASTSLNFGGDDDVLLSNSGTVGSIGTLNFGGDDGADILRNFGTLGALTFSGGADDDILQNAAGATLTSLSFGGDDGIDTLWNQGAVTTLTFGGGADDDILLNSAGATISSLNFGGDDGSDLLNNLGTVGTLTFGGGADDDILVNTGSITGSLSFGGDDGADLLQNTGAIAGLTFGGGADDDILLNSGTGTIATLGFGGDDGIDTLQNTGAITTLNFGGGADGDIFINLSGASVGTMFFGGGYEADGSGGWRPLATAADDGADSLANSGTITSLVFRGGADDDVLLNSVGGLITTLKFGGDDGADLLRNLGTATNLTFGGGADDDILVNTGTVAGSLVFGGDQQFDAAGNLQPIDKLSDDGADTLANYGTVGSIVFGGGADDDILLNSGTGSVTGSLSFAGDSGDDVFRNEGLAGSLIFTGGADDDVLVNLSAGIGTINFGGDAGNDILLNQGSGVGTLTFTGGADDDQLLNTASTLTTLTFSGGADDDVLQNSGGSITTLTFTGDSGADILRNTGSGITSLVFGGGADDDILSSTGTNIGSLVFGGDIDATTGLPIAGTNSGADRLILSGTGTGAGTATVLFQGDDGADAFLNSATGFITITFNGGADDDVFQNTASSIGGITFSGGADDDVLQNSGASLTSLVFGGDSGADVLYNTGASVSGLVFTGGADDDVFYNTGAALSGAIFTGGADDDVLVNSGADVSGLVFTGGADDDVLQNAGAGLLDLVFSGDAGNDRFWNRSTAVNSANLLFTGADGDDLFLNDAGGVLGLTFTGGADDDALQNSGVNVSGLVFEGGADDDVLVNTSAGSILDLQFGGGADDDILQNSGSITTLLIGGGADSDTLANWGSVTSLEFMGDGQFDSNGDLQQISNAADDGVDTLVNYGTVQTLTFGGGADDDVFVNNGEVTNLTFNGGADDDTLQNNDVVSVLTFNGGADDDVLIANADGVGDILFNGDDGVDSLINNGDAVASLTFNGGAGADVLRVHGTGLGSIIFNGGTDAAADTFNYSGTGATGSGVTFAGGAGNDLLAWRGSADTLSFTGGDGDDVCIIVGSGTLSLDGGDGNDTVYFQADLRANVTVVEGGGGSGDTSSDTLNFSSYTGAALNLDLRSTTAQAQSSKFSLTLSNGLGVENVVGTAGADTIYGNARNNRIDGAEYSDGYGTATGGTRGQTQWVLLDFDSRTDLAAGEHEYTTSEREAIRARVQSVYRGPDSGSPWFDVQVVLAVASIPSGVSDYVTIYFNDTPAFGRPGGLASEIDPGNLNFGGTAVVQVNGLVGGVITADDTGGEGGDADAYKGYQPGFGDEQIGAAKPDATSENFVLLSAKIAAHELAHLMGLRHQDSFGPIGFGVHDPPGVNGYNPQFPGPAGGVETFDHMLGTGASVGSDRFNDLRNLFFGEREAIKLALSVSDHSQTFATESSSAHGTYLTAQALALTTVAVPNTLSTGLNENKSIYVQMKSVVGAIAVDSGTGKSQNDWYSFTGSAGDVVNLDLYSNSLTRYGTAADNYIDSIVRVWYVQGGVLTEVPWFTSTAVNDDIFEPTDSSILDLLLPVTGTYYVEVDTFKRDPSNALFDASNPSSPLNPSNPNNLLRPGYEDLLKRFLDTRDDTDIGQYQLVLSRFTKSNESDGTDTIRGYGGVDQINAGAGDDYSLVVTVGGAGTSTEGAAFSRSISVTDRAATSWVGSTVNYGDGSGNQSLTMAADGTATLTHTWTDNGTYTVTVTIVDDIGQSQTETFNVTVSNVNPVLLTLTGESNPIEGTTHTYSFTASDIGADTFSLFSVSGGSFGTISDFAVNSTTGAGSFKVTFGAGASTVISLTLQDDDGGVSNQLTLTATIQLLNNAPTNISLSPAVVSENAASGTVVGTLSSADPDGDAVFTYSLVAGAGSTDNALFSISGGQLRTAAIFDYEQSATRSVRIRTTDAGGLSFEKAFTVTITDVLDETAPVSTLAALAVNATTVNLTITASGSDPGANASGVKEFELYYSTGSGYSLFATVPAASPSTAFTALPNRTYWFHSRAVDNAGNRESKTTADTYTIIGDIVPPSSEVSSLTWNASGQFELQITGSKPSGRILQYFDVYMTVDGGVATKVDSVSATQTGTGQYAATSRVLGLLDGVQHTYGFYTRAVDGTGNVESAPGTPDKTATVTFSDPGLAAMSIRVQNGMSQRSYVRYLDVLFSGDPSALSAGRIKVERLPITAASITAVPWTTVTGYGVTASAADRRLRLDFGATGLGGSKQAGDGFYRVSYDGNGNSVFGEAQDASFEFFRLYGDANGNGNVATDDLNLVLSQMGQSGAQLNGDLDGNGVVNITDRLATTQRAGQKLRDWMLLLLDG